jgi:hypothetical protein
MLFLQNTVKYRERKKLKFIKRKLEKNEIAANKLFERETIWGL